MSIDLTGVTHHPAMEELVEVLCNKTQNTDKGFFRTELAYFFGKVASCMRATVVTKDRGEIPVNIYALALATSGYGKGHSVNVVENEVLKGFKTRFMDDTLPVVAETNLHEIAKKRAARKNADLQKTIEKVEKEYEGLGKYAFTFDSATPEAVKQLRQKLLMAAAGSINLQIDEIGSKLLSNTDALTVFLELYDQGLVKQKLIKNTADNVRIEEMDGKTPANMLLFGTPTKLLDGAQTEDEFYSFLETGYARRCLFGWGQAKKKAVHSMTPEEIYARLTQPANNAVVDKWTQHFTDLADPVMFEWKMEVPDDVGIALLAYRLDCERQAEEMADHEDIKKAEMTHRYFKVLKLAGAYAFIDKSSEVEMGHLKQAVLLVEESGQAFQAILNREKAYVKLAKYIATCGTEVTHADLVEALPYYKQGNQARNELMTLATAWGYKQNILVKKRFADGIEFFKGETLQVTDLSKLLMSVSHHFAYHYQVESAPFDQLHVVCQGTALDDEGKPIGPYQWANHAFTKGHRAEESVIPGFNMVVLDVDGGTPLATVVTLMKEYKFFLHTTKRHTPEANRFRMVLPINYHLELDSEEYKEFMQNILNWLPFSIDESANQRSRKWEAFNGPGAQHLYNHEGEILDVLKFVPKTAKNEQYLESYKQIESMSNLERWFAERIAVGNRNNNMLRFAMALVDARLSLQDVMNQVTSFNDRLSNPLRKDELQTTIFRTVAKRYQAKM